jgi:hypothetical protein
MALREFYGSLIDYNVIIQDIKDERITVIIYGLQEGGICL